MFNNYSTTLFFKNALKKHLDDPKCIKCLRVQGLINGLMMYWQRFCTDKSFECAANCCQPLLGRTKEQSSDTQWSGSGPTCWHSKWSGKERENQTQNPTMRLPFALRTDYVMNEYSWENGVQISSNISQLSWAEPLRWSQSMSVKMEADESTPRAGYCEAVNCGEMTGVVI